MKKPFATEAELHRRILKAIERDEFVGLIIDEAGMTHARAGGGNHFPQMSIDHVSRRAALDLGSEVYRSLAMLEVLASDVNISSTKSEVLRPDIVCINAELQSVVLFELKKSHQTGREALTELLAYEQEVRNLVPFLSTYDINCVLISTEWSPLLDHAAASAIAWSGKRLLCLQAHSEGGLKLTTRIPNAWRMTGSVLFPETALPTVTVVLEEKEAYSDGKQEERAYGGTEELDPRLWTALQVMAREGDRRGAHGFALLWRDHLDTSLSRFNITVCGVAPFAFFESSRRRGILTEEAGRLVRPLAKVLSTNGLSGHSHALMAVATAANEVLQEIADPQIEGLHDWRSDRVLLKNRAEPLACEFWGILGDFSREYVLSPAVRRHRAILNRGQADWRQPGVGVPLIDSLVAPTLFRDGDVRCSDAFRLGVLLGLDRTLRLALQQRNPGMPGAIRSRFEWNKIELIAALDEVILLASAAENVRAPATPLKYHPNPETTDAGDHDALVSWIVTDFFRHSVMHALFLKIGYEGAQLFDQVEGDPFRARPDISEWKDVSDDMRAAVGVVLTQAEEARKTGSVSGELLGGYAPIRSLLGIRLPLNRAKLASLTSDLAVTAWEQIVWLSDLVLDPVWHVHSPVSTPNIDWEWFKQGVKEMRGRGVDDAGVILLANGQFVTGPVRPEDLRNVKMDFGDGEETVAFADRSSGLLVVRVVSWEDLRSGAAFRRRAKGGE